MGKAQRQKAHPRSAGRDHARPSLPSKQKSQSRAPKLQSTVKIANEHHQRPILPFSPTDQVLLVGEGDFSFAHSLFVHHRNNFRTLCATCLDGREELLGKYPQAERFITILSSPGEASKDPDTSRSITPSDGVALPSSDDAISVSSSFYSDGDRLESDTRFPMESRSSVLYSVDATALHKHRYLRVRKWDRIAFNFPHVGGKSTDVNRQVRYNQSLIHAFLKSCIPLLSSPNGTILVTLFEGAPYELWNIRDLGRSAGLRVVRSFAFQADLYPEYRHARTFGNVREKDGTSQDAQEAEGQEGSDNDEDLKWIESKGRSRPGKWRGEERKARTYEFGLAQRDGSMSHGAKRKRKRKSNGDGYEGDPFDE